MKYLKLFEGLRNRPQVGDYAIVDFGNNSIWCKYVSNNIGEVVGILDHYLIFFEVDDWIYDKFFDDPSESLDTRTFRKGLLEYRNGVRGLSVQLPPERILAFSDNKEDLQLKLDAKRYNI
jgi:hypothetical protein